ncbi:LysR family transcriptional regulator [Pokkaliibacter plantistimulans]|uniref:LysR family transcriptional regulator n=1 Tax=Proteobacteria bacterium 228 TaxID=2083153 RepID=A0A2S5KLU3_9PROT|nr:LysR family transcriptional regulator [Pokkaliibacter plantistimulans]PPC75710.1 LysR family transcriptional regulator [Pokkaliibacter plantistimulans]
MNTRFVETFIMLAKVRSVREVARQMHTTPGTVSMRIKTLEESLGVRLFEWDFKTLELTVKGARLLSYAEHVVDAAQAFERAAAPQTHTGRLRLGVNETVVLTVLPAFMRIAERVMPGVQIDFSVELTHSLKERLIMRELDLIVHVSGDQTPFIHSEELLEVSQQWIAKPRPISTDTPITQVLRKQLITQMRNTVPYEQVSNMVQEMGSRHGMLAADIRLSGSPSLAAMVSLVKVGLGVGIMPALLVLKELEDGELIQLPFPSTPPTRMSLSHMRNASPIVTDTAELLRKVCRRFCRRQNPDHIRFSGYIE